MNKELFIEKFKLFYHKITEVTTSCLLLMTKGDLSAITLTHWGKALSTSSLTGATMVILSFIKANKQFYENKYLLASLTSLITMVVDFQIHPSHYKGNYTEAIMTGLASGTLSIILTKFWDNNKEEK